MLLSTSNFGKDGFRLHNFRHGEAPWREKELRTLVPLTLEVERNRNTSTQQLKFQITNTFLNFFNDLVARARAFQRRSGWWAHRSRRLMPGHLRGCSSPPSFSR